jgi:CheY-like chemotaxis protein/HPt (histidine-containing phosphotransfer) domain-containing protein/two-component sensor histidine kinase
MHGVLGMTDLLLHSGLSDRQQGFAVSAHESAHELLGLIDNILDFSKIEAGKLELEETTFNLREIVENLCYLYGELAQTKNLELNLIFHADLRRQLYGDPVRLRQILQNLLSNAIKFTKRGSVTVVVEELAREGKHLKLRFTVEDSGIGMTEETLQRIFDAFSQADSSTTRQYGGTGLGLSIAKQLVQLMDGDFAVSSKPGVGTSMSVQLTLMESPIYTDKLATSAFEGYYAEVVAMSPETRAMLRTQAEALLLTTRDCSAVEELPVRADHERVVLVDVGCLYDLASIALVANLAEDEKTVVLLVAPLSLQGIPVELRHLPHTIKPTRLSSLVNDILGAMSPADVQRPMPGQLPMMRFKQRVLLVEDMPANQEIARAMLESFGCSVDIGKNGEVALEMYQQESYDFILMDCQMPVMDGFEATRHIRQLESQRSSSHRIPIVALTAGKTEVEKERCYASGMDRILFKPYSTADLNSLLAQYFEAAGEFETVTVPPVETELVGEILDVKALDNIRSIDGKAGNNLLARVFENFKIDVPSKLDELRANLDKPEVLGAAAHAIKSMSLNIGAKALAEYCRRCEADWKNKLIGDAGREIEVIRGHYLDAVRALEPIVETSTTTVGS